MIAAWTNGARWNRPTKTTNRAFRHLRSWHILSQLAYCNTNDCAADAIGAQVAKDAERERGWVSAEHEAKLRGEPESRQNQHPDSEAEREKKKS
jgi:hypothetical protein